MDGSYRDNQKMYGGGNNKQGLPPSIGFGRFSTNLIQRKAGYCKCVLSRGTNQPEPTHPPEPTPPPEPEPPLSVTITFESPLNDGPLNKDGFRFTSDTAGYYRITGSANNYTFEAYSFNTISHADLLNKTLTIYSAAISSITCNSLNVSAITLNYAPLLASLRCYGNTITTLDVSNLVKLTNLYCPNNNISILDVTTLVKLTYLNCSYNKIITLNVTNLKKLAYLGCSDNNINILDVTNLTLIANLTCFKNNLKVLDVTNLTQLTFLICFDNTIETLIVTNLTKLTNLNCSYNLLDQSNAKFIATAIRTHPIYTGILGISAQKNGTINTTINYFTALKMTPYNWTIN